MVVERVAEVAVQPFASLALAVEGGSLKIEARQVKANSSNWSGRIRGFGSRKTTRRESFRSRRVDRRSHSAIAVVLLKPSVTSCGRTGGVRKLMAPFSQCPYWLFAQKPKPRLPA